MKRKLSTVLVLILCICVSMMFTGCGENKDENEAYGAYDLSEYIKLADYDAFKVEKPVPEKVTELEIEKGIQQDLYDYGIVYEVSEGVAMEGDTIKISYEGRLEDGTTKEGMSATDYTITLGEGNMIPGFEEGLYGAKVGETTSVHVTFPDPYTTDQELSGKNAIFDVKVTSIREVRLPELTDALIREAHDGVYNTVDEYMADVKRYYEELHAEEAKQAVKDDLFARLVEESEVLQYPEEKINAEASYYMTKHMEYAANNQFTWEDYLSDTLGMTEKEFEKAATTYAEEAVKRDMLIYAMAEKEGLEVTEEEYQAEMKDFLANTMRMTEEKFQEQMGMTIEAYAEEFHLERDMLMEEALEVLYNRLIGA